MLKRIYSCGVVTNVCQRNTRCLRNLKGNFGNSFFASSTTLNNRFSTSSTMVEKQDFEQNNADVGEMDGVDGDDAVAKQMKVVQSSHSNQIDPDDEVRQFVNSGLIRRRAPRLEKSKIGTVQIPDTLHRRIMKLLKDVPKDRLAAEAQWLSENLRARTRKVLKGKNAQNKLPPVIVYDRARAAAYAAHRMPGVYACLARVFAELKLRRPDFVPSRMLDYGSGPGTAILAMNHLYPDVLQHVAAIEPSVGMQSIGEELLGETLRKKTSYNRYDVPVFRGGLSGKQPELPYGEELPPPTNPDELYDICTLSYVLSELATPKVRRRLLRSLWSRLRVGSVLAIIEPGTPVGFSMIREARNVLLHLEEFEESETECDARMIAPCPHNDVCPLDITKTWCHFGQRLVRNPITQQTKQAQAKREDEKFSYILVEKVDSNSAIEPSLSSRIIRPPGKRGGHVVLHTCRPDATAEAVTVTKSQDKLLYTSARKSGWGDSIVQLPLKGEKDEFVLDETRVYADDVFVADERDNDEEEQ